MNAKPTALPVKFENIPSELKSVGLLPVSMTPT